VIQGEKCNQCKDVNAVMESGGIRLRNVEIVRHSDITGTIGERIQLADGRVFDPQLTYKKGLSVHLYWFGESLTAPVYFCSHRCAFEYARAHNLIVTVKPNFMILPDIEMPSTRT
jgi:glutaredoxin